MIARAMMKDMMLVVYKVLGDAMRFSSFDGMISLRDFSLNLSEFNC